MFLQFFVFFIPFVVFVDFFVFIIVSFFCLNNVILCFSLRLLFLYFLKFNFFYLGMHFFLSVSQDDNCSMLLGFETSDSREQVITVLRYEIKLDYEYEFKRHLTDTYPRIPRIHIE